MIIIIIIIFIQVPKLHPYKQDMIFKSDIDFTIQEPNCIILTLLCQHTGIRNTSDILNEICCNMDGCSTRHGLSVGEHYL